MLKNRVCACLLVTLLLAAMLPVSVAAAGELPSGTPAYEQNTFVGVSPLGTTINLFDYWLTEQTDSDGKNPDDFENRGINQDHALLFGSGMGNDGQPDYGDWNKWTKGSDPRKGIVASRLDKDGYPVLNLNTSGTAIDGRNGKESLAYLFDPTFGHDGKFAYEDVQNLLQIDTGGYYSYDSQRNYAVFYKDTNSFLLYNHPGVMSGGAAGTIGQFFPFNAVNSWNGSLYNSGMTSIDDSINHYFGVHMSTRFVQQNGGYTDETKENPIIYEFSGDDDVWVFIDGVLVADLGGIHDLASLSINFATGVITINEDPQYQKLGDLLNTGSATLPDETYHTLDFFYLERGNVDSNMSLKYNLVYVPESNIYKIDQNGDPLPGLTFELCKAERQPDGSYAAGDVLAEGTTDAEGRIILLDEKNDLLTIQKLIQKLNITLPDETTALILRETDSPDDRYRSSGDLELYFYQPASQTGSPPFLLSKNHWQTGAHAVARLTATTDEEIKYGDGLSTTFKPEENLMFAVVFKKVGEKWLPISGSSATGWTVAANDSWESIREANLYRFVLSSSGSYTAMIDELPGDVKKYVEAGGAEDSYRIVYYFSNQKDPQAINEKNTFEITSDMNRVAAVNLYVPNIRNDLTVQKLDQNGNLITGGRATFALRQASPDGTYNPSATAVRTLDTFEGEATFTAIPNGVYYLVETDAPDGYTANATPVKVIVNDTGVYANAGTAEDGISVERGVGRLVNSMAQFASKDTVDTTLNQIVAKFYTIETEEPHEGFQWREIKGTGDKAAFSPVGGVVYHPAYSVAENPPQNTEWYLFGTAPGSVATTPVGMHLAHLANHSGGRCDGLYQTTVTLASGGPGITAQETDTGWSALLVEQCMLHTRHSGTPHTNLTGKNLTDLTALFTGDVTVKVKNDRIVGNLAVQKTVAGNAGETDREWEFTIELKNANRTALSGDFHYEGESIVTDVTPPQGGKLTFDSDGKATIRLKHGQKITIKGIPANATYTVTETEANKEGYGTTPGNGTASGKIEVDNTATAAFTNTKSVYQRLTVEKTVEGADGDKDKAWEFTIELKNADETALSGSFRYKGESIEGVDQPPDDTLTFDSAGKATIRLKHGQKIIIEDIPVNATYTVTETEAGKDGYVTTPNVPISGKIEAGKDATASFTNSKTILRGGLTVTKTVAGNAGDKGREWNFTVTLGDTSISDIYGDMSFTGGKATFTLKHGEQKTATGLPAGIDYFVSEAEASQDGYTTQATDASGQIPAEGTATAAFTNMKSIPRGNLSVSKTVSGSNPPSKTAFGFTVILSDRTVDGRFGEMTFRSGVAEFTLRHGETVTASGLPAGVGYLVQEEANEAYTVSSEGAEGLIEPDGTATARFVNRRIVLPPKTGDDSHTELWFMLMAFSLCCAAFLIGHQKRGGRTGR